MKGSARVGFGDFVLDGGTRQLLRDGTERHLEPKAFALLELLVARRPDAVSKAEVRDRLWPDAFVSESTLTGLVAQVRRALDDRGPDERYIRTVHGFGYAFVGQATTLDADRPPDGGLQPTTASAGAVARIIWDDRVFPLCPGVSVIGRAEDAAVSIDLPGISRGHARIVISEGEATLEDLGSKNGTFVGDQRLSAPVALAEGDMFRLGRVALVFRWAPSSVSTRTDGLPARATDPPASR